MVSAPVYLSCFSSHLKTHGHIPVFTYYSYHTIKHSETSINTCSRQVQYQVNRKRCFASNLTPLEGYVFKYFIGSINNIVIAAIPSLRRFGHQKSLSVINRSSAHEYTQGSIFSNGHHNMHF